MLTQVIIDLYGEPPATLAVFMELNLLSIILYVILVVTAIRVYHKANKNRWLSLSTSIILSLGLLVPALSLRKFAHHYQSVIISMEPAWSYIEPIISLLVPILLALSILTLIKALHYESSTRAKKFKTVSAREVLYRTSMPTALTAVVS